MSGPALVGFGASDDLAPADTLRVTFVQRHPLVSLDSQFVGDFAGVYAQLTIPTTTQDKFWSVNPNSASPGATTCVQDLRLFQYMTAAAFLSLLDDVCGTWIMASRVEKLDGTAAAESTSADGAKERDALAARQQQATDSAPGILGDIGAGFSKYLGTLKWVAIAAAVGLTMLALMKTENDL